MTPERGALPWFSPGVRAMAAGAVAFSVMSVLVKSLGQRLPSHEMVLARSLISLALSAWAIRRAGLTFSGHRPSLLVLRGLMGFGALVCYFYSVTHLPLCDATIIHFANPVFTGLLAALLLGERLTWLRSLCVGVGLFGTLLVVRPDMMFANGEVSVNRFAVVVALFGAVLSAFAYVAVRRLRASDHPTVVVFYFALIATIGGAVLSAGSLVWPTPLEWVLLVAMGIAGQVGQVCITHGLHLEPAGKATAIGYLQVVLSYGFGILLFAEEPTATAILGSVLIFASVAWIAKTSDARPV